MDRKYELVLDDSIEVSGATLYRIRALVDFGNVKKGDVGGYIKNECNLSHQGNCWIYDNALVYGNASVSGNAKVSDYAKIFENANICGNAKVYDNAWIYEKAKISDNAIVYGDALVCGNARIYGNAEIHNNIVISLNNTRMCGDSVKYKFQSTMLLFFLKNKDMAQWIKGRN